MGISREIDALFDIADRAASQGTEHSASLGWPETGPSVDQHAAPTAAQAREDGVKANLWWKFRWKGAAGAHSGKPGCSPVLLGPGKQGAGLGWQMAPLRPTGGDSERTAAAACSPESPASPYSSIDQGGVCWRYPHWPNPASELGPLSTLTSWQLLRRICHLIWQWT